MKPTGNFLAASPAAAAPGTAPKPPTQLQPPSKPAAPPARTPISDGSSQAPMIGDRQKIAQPPAPSIGSTATPRQSNDVQSGMVTALGAMADKMHPARRGR